MGVGGAGGIGGVLSGGGGGLVWWRGRCVNALFNTNPSGNALVGPQTITRRLPSLSSVRPATRAAGRRRPANW